MTEFSSTSGDDDPCAELMRHLWTLLDGECTPECTAELRQKLLKHLKDCPPCEGDYRLEEQIKALIASKCGGEKAPQGLRERLRLEIQRTTIIRGMQ